MPVEGWHAPDCLVLEAPVPGVPVQAVAAVVADVEVAAAAGTKEEIEQNMN